MSEKNELVPVPEAQALVTSNANPLNPFVTDARQAAFWTSLPIATQEGKFMAQEAMSGEVESMDRWLNRVFIAEHALSHPFTKVDPESGEEFNGIRVVLISPAGDMVAFCSAGATRCLRRLAMMYGPPPWNRGLPLECGQIPLGDKKRTYTLKVPRDFNPAMNYAEEGYAPPAPAKK
jgi:hypothetical protein